LQIAFVCTEILIVTGTALEKQNLPFWFYSVCLCMYLQTTGKNGLNEF